MDTLINQISGKGDENIGLGREILSWRDVVDRLNSENTELKQMIEDLEHKNRKLVDKLNEQIYNHATDYK